MCSNMKSYYFSAYSGYNMLSERREMVYAKKPTWMHLKVTMYNTLEWHKVFSYIYRTFCKLSYLNYDITCIIILEIWYFMQDLSEYIIIKHFKKIHL